MGLELGADVAGVRVAEPGASKTLSSSEYGDDETSSSEGSEEEMLAIVNHQHSRSLTMEYVDNNSQISTSRARETEMLQHYLDLV